MSNEKYYPLHPNATHPPVMTCEIPLEEYESMKKELNFSRQLIKTMKDVLVKHGIDSFSMTYKEEG